MTFASRDAFPARSGIDDKPDRFPVTAPGNRHDAPEPTAAEPCGSIGTESERSRDSSVTNPPLPSGQGSSPGSPGWVGARDGTPSGASASEKATLDPATARSSARDGSRSVELHAHSAYSFLDGASLPEELAARAAELEYDALALTDHDGVYGSLEFAHAAKHLGVRPITGAEITLADGAHVTLLCETQEGYTNLCRILTDAHARTRLPGRERDLLSPETSI